MKKETAFIINRNGGICLDIFIILGIGLLSISWFRGNHLINSGDFCLPLNRLRYFNLTLYLWDATVATGILMPHQVAGLIPYALYGGITELLGLSLVFFEKSLFYLLFAFSGLNMYFLTYVLGIKRIGRMMSSLFYMMSPISLTITWGVSIGFHQPAYVFAPLILGLYIYGLKNQKGINYIIFSGIIFLLFITWSYIWPVVIALHGLAILVYFLCNVILNMGIVSKKFVLKYTLYFIGLLFLLNMFWIIPVFMSADQIYKLGSNPSLGFISNIATLEMNSAKLLGSFRLMGQWNLKGSYLGDYFCEWGARYSSLPFVMVTFLIPIFALFSLFTKKRDMKLVSVYFWIVALIGLFFAKGPIPPLGYLYAYIYKIFPWIALAFRMGFIAFSIPIALAFSPLVGIGVSETYYYIKKNKPWLAIATILIIFVLFFGVLAYPFWTGNVIRPPGKNLPSERIKIPAYYSQADAWLAKENHYFRILSLPMSRNYTVFYNWNDIFGKNYGYTGADIMKWYSLKPVIYININPVINAIGEFLSNQNNISLPKKTIALLNVRYILLHKDFNWNAVSGHDWFFKHNLKNLETRLSNLEQVNIAGKLHFYKLGEESLPHIYSTQKQIVITNLSDFIPVVESDAFKPGQQNIIIVDQNTNKNIPMINSNRRPFISFVEINPTKYKISIQDAHEPFYLIFSESFNRGWRAYINTDMMKCSPIATYANVNVIECRDKSKFFEIKDITRIFDRSVPEEDHFVVNGYANGWYVYPGKLGLGEGFSLTLYFWPQTIYYVSLFVSGLTLIGCICYLLCKRMRIKNKNYSKG